MRPNGQARGEVSGSALTILLTVMFVNMIGFGIIVPLLPFYAESFKAASWQVALIFSAYSVGAFFGEPFWGRLSDRWGRKPVLMLTVCGNCACYLALAFARDRRRLPDPFPGRRRQRQQFGGAILSRRRHA